MIDPIKTIIIYYIAPNRRFPDYRAPLIGRLITSNHPKSPNSNHPINSNYSATTNYSDFLIKVVESDDQINRVSEESGFLPFSFSTGF